MIHWARNLFATGVAASALIWGQGCAKPYVIANGFTKVYTPQKNADGRIIIDAELPSIAMDGTFTPHTFLNGDPGFRVSRPTRLPPFVSMALVDDKDGPSFTVTWPGGQEMKVLDPENVRATKKRLVVDGGSLSWTDLHPQDFDNAVIAISAAAPRIAWRLLENSQNYPIWELDLDPTRTDMPYARGASSATGVVLESQKLVVFWFNNQEIPVYIPWDLVPKDIQKELDDPDALLEPIVFKPSENKDGISKEAAPVPAPAPASAAKEEKLPPTAVETKAAPVVPVPTLAPKAASDAKADPATTPEVKAETPKEATSASAPAPVPAAKEEKPAPTAVETKATPAAAPVPTSDAKSDVKTDPAPKTEKPLSAEQKAIQEALKGASSSPGPSAAKDRPKDIAPMVAEVDLKTSGGGKVDLGEKKESTVDDKRPWFDQADQKLNHIMPFVENFNGVMVRATTPDSTLTPAECAAAAVSICRRVNDYYSHAAFNGGRLADLRQGYQALHTCADGQVPSRLGFGDIIGKLNDAKKRIGVDFTGQSPADPSELTQNTRNFVRNCPQDNWAALLKKSSQPK